MQIYNNFKNFISRNSNSIEIEDRNINIEIVQQDSEENIEILGK